MCTPSASDRAVHRPDWLGLAVFFWGSPLIHRGQPKRHAWHSRHLYFLP
jgi:hypothetical protein